MHSKRVYWSSVVCLLLGACGGVDGQPEDAEDVGVEVSALETWTPCAVENGICSFSGTKSVRYGANGSYVTKIALNSIACDNATFGDPIYGTVKSCDVASENNSELMAGDTTCPVGYSLATPAEALANNAAACSKLGTWDIARLSGGGSMDGPGYGCGIRSVDTRGLGHAVCKKAVQFTKGIGDGVCPSGYTAADSMVARANASATCSMLGTWDIARLAGGGSMDGPGYGCGIRDIDSRGLGHTVCVQLDVVRAVGDKPCAAGTALISPQNARARQAELCGKLGTWDIARLDGGGSMDGPGYGCTVRDADTRTLGHALCGAL